MNQQSSYLIKSKHSNRVLDICQHIDKKGMAIIYDKTNTPNQQFYLKQNGQQVEIISKQTNKLLTIAANSSKNGTPVFEEPTRGLQGQKFRLQEVSPGSQQYIIYTFCGKVLDCCQCAKANGTKVIQYEYNGQDNQRWIIKKI